MDCWDPCAFICLGREAHQHSERPVNGNQELEQATVVAEVRQDPCMEVPHHQCLLILAEDFENPICITLFKTVPPQ